MLRSVLLRIVLPIAFAAGVVALLVFPLIETLVVRWTHAGDQTSARNFLVIFVAVSVLAIALLGAGVVWIYLRRWAEVLIGDIRGKRFSDDAQSAHAANPILSQVREALQQAEQSQRLEIDFSENWTPQALQHVVETFLKSPQVIIASNREPYSHSYDADGALQVHVPASGMVTALEPVVRACAGTWVAHGSGSADRESVDRFDRVRVPPEEPAYALRRVWLSEQEEAGYYYGFANEGLWPLCHLAYVRPAFRESDWHSYESVNRKFASVICSEARGERPLVLVQDFHLALTPGLIRQRKPKATIVLFWHIPWPNAETFGVCPWRRELLAHMLAPTFLAFIRCITARTFWRQSIGTLNVRSTMSTCLSRLASTCAALHPIRSQSNGRRTH